MSNQYNILFETKTLYGLALHIDTAIIQTSKNKDYHLKKKMTLFNNFQNIINKHFNLLKKLMKILEYIFLTMKSLW